LRVVSLADGAGPGEPLLLLEPARPETRGWGTAVVRVGPASPSALTAPQPALEAGTDRLAFALFEDTRARALMIGGSRRSYVPALADEWQTGGLQTTHFAFHTAAHRALSAGGEPSPLLLQVRGLASFRTLPDALIVGLGAPLLEEGPTSARLRALLEGTLGGFAPRRFARGESDTIGLDGWHEPSIRFSHDLGGAQAAMLWFSESVRRPFVTRDEGASAALSAPLGFSRIEGGASRFFALEENRARVAAALDPETEARIALAARALEQAATGQTPHPLRRLASEPGARVSVGFDPIAGSDFLALELALDGALLRAVSFSPDPTRAALRLGPDASDELERALLVRDAQIVLVLRSRASP
jgi:hypothetical protein